MLRKSDRIDFSMRNNEVTVLGEADKEIKDFLEKVRAAGNLLVQIGDDVFEVKVSVDSVSNSARNFLVKGSGSRK